MTATLDLPADQLKQVQQILASHVPDTRVWAFGSRASGKARPFSDLDLAICAKAPLDWKTLARLREAFEAADLDVCVDVVDWSQASDAFKRAVEQSPLIPVT